MITRGPGKHPLVTILVHRCLFCDHKLTISIRSAFILLASLLRSGVFLPTCNAKLFASLKRRFYLRHEARERPSTSDVDYNCDCNLRKGKILRTTQRKKRHHTRSSNSPL